VTAEKPRRLGRGLEALIPGAVTPGASVGTSLPASDLQRIPLSRIRRNPFQPRREFDPTELAELQASLQASGLLQPISVRRRGDAFELIAVEDVSVKGDWRYDPGSNTVFSAKSDTQNLDFSATSTRYEPSPAELDAAGFVAHGDVPSTYLELPPTLNPDVIALAESITAKATSPFAKALAIQSYLTSPSFHYDTTVPASDSADALEQFLLVSKRGFCQQFSAAMAVLARIVQIPSRVAVGFTHGVRQPDAGASGGHRSGGPR